MEPEFPPGAHATDEGTHFTIWSAHADTIDLILFDSDGDAEVARERLRSEQGGWHHAFVEGVRPGTRYGYRAAGRFDPAAGHWFDPAKLLVDPWAVAIDRPYAYDPRLAERGFDSAPLMPKAIVTALPDPPFAEPPHFAPGGLIYELPVRAFTMLRPDIAAAQRGTLAALACPAVIAHLRAIGVAAVELMPVTAWIDERHLDPLGLTNGWGYNPVSFLALDPRLAPGGLAELRDTVEALHVAGIGVILDVVFNHTGESDEFGPTLSLRGLDGASFFRSVDGRLVNDTGCGNTLACDRAPVRRLILDALRHFVRHAGIDGFRFDLAPILGRGEAGFDPKAALFAEMAADPLLADRVMIAEPWDIGFGGYQLGHFPANFLEWNDRYRDDVRRFWRGDTHMIGDLATRLAGSSDLFAPPVSRSVNFLAAHDGFALADLVAFERKHNEANGEDNRDGHNENLSWNNGVEGASDDPDVAAARRRDLMALLATLFASRGTIMLTAGDEFGRTQQGNNNAYCQDNALTWLDWEGRDRELEAFVVRLAALRAASPRLADPQLLGEADVTWLTPAGTPLAEQDWRDPETSVIAMRLLARHGGTGVTVCINRSRETVRFADPPCDVAARSVQFVVEDQKKPAHPE